MSIGLTVDGWQLTARTSGDLQQQLTSQPDDCSCLSRSLVQQKLKWIFLTVNRQRSTVNA
jgi:hypothetical protein